MRLGDILASRRRHYSRPLPTLPDICVIDIPQPYASPSLPLGRYYPVIIETEAEWAEWDHFLATDRIVPCAPDLFDRRPSALHAGTITFAHYDPAETGWPWILLCCWPADHVARAGDEGDLFARSAYSVEIAATHAERDAMADRVLDRLGRDRALNLTFIPASPVAGKA